MWYDSGKEAHMRGVDDTFSRPSLLPVGFPGWNSDYLVNILSYTSPQRPPSHARINPAVRAACLPQARLVTKGVDEVKPA